MKSNVTTSLIALLAFLMFSLGDAGIKIGSAGYSTFQVAAVVNLFSLMLILTHLVHQGRLRNPLPELRLLTIIRSCLRIIQVPCLFYAFANIPLATVYSAIFIMPIMTVFLGAVFLKERIGPRRIFAVLSCFVGVLIAMNPSVVTLDIGYLGLAIFVVTGAVDTLLVKRASHVDPVSVLGLWPTLNVTITMWALSLPNLQPMPADTIATLALTATAGWAGGLLNVYALRRGPVVSATSMQYSQIIWASIIGYFVFDEPTSMQTIIGALIITASGLYIMLHKESASAPHKQAPSPSS